MSLRTMSGAFVAVALLLTTGCGVSSWVVAPDSQSPISMSNGLRGPDGRVIPPEHIHPVGRFEKRYLACSMLWRIVSFTGDKNISDDVNEQVKALGADAVKNLSITSGVPGCQLFPLLDLFPDCSKVALRGDIVTVDLRRRAPPPPPASPPPPPVATNPPPPIQAAATTTGTP